MKCGGHITRAFLCLVSGLLVFGASQSLAQEPTAEYLARANNPNGVGQPALQIFTGLNMQFN